MINEMDINMQQLNMMLHIIGWQKANNDGLIIGSPYREYKITCNGFTAQTEGCFEMIKPLQELGFIHCFYNGQYNLMSMKSYCVTEKGLKWLSKLLCCELIDITMRCKPTMRCKS